MGACQTYAWAAMHPEMVAAAAPISGSARTGDYNKVFLAGLRRAITSDPDFNDGFYGDKPPIKGMKVFASIYAGWGFSEPFYREEIYRAFGAATVEEFIDYFWDTFFIKCDANDLIAQIWTWWNNDLGDHPQLRRRLRGRAGRDHRPHDHPQRRDRPVLPAGRQRVRGAAHPRGGGAPDPDDLGPPGAVQPRGPGLHRPR